MGPWGAPSPGTRRPPPAELVDLATLLRRADVVSLHARLTEETHRLIGREELALMKPTAVLVNTARSGLVDEQALVEALASRRIMGAAIDVFDTEPLPRDHPLLAPDNVTRAPHGLTGAGPHGNLENQRHENRVRCTKKVCPRQRRAPRAGRLLEVARA